MPQISFDPFVEEQRRWAEEIIAVARRTSAAVSPAPTVASPHSADVISAVDARILRFLAHIVNRTVGKVLIAAAAHYEDGVTFDWPDVSFRSGHSVETILSWNRSLGRCLRKAGIRHSDLLTVVPGTPKRFKMESMIRKAIDQLTAPVAIPAVA